MRGGTAVRADLLARAWGWICHMLGPADNPRIADWEPAPEAETPQAPQAGEPVAARWQVDLHATLRPGRSATPERRADAVFRARALQRHIWETTDHHVARRCTILEDGSVEFDASDG